MIPADVDWSIKECLGDGVVKMTVESSQGLLADTICI